MRPTWIGSSRSAEEHHHHHRRPPVILPPPEHLLLLPSPLQFQNLPPISFEREGGGGGDPQSPTFSQLLRAAGSDGGDEREGDSSSVISKRIEALQKLVGQKNNALQQLRDELASKDILLETFAKLYYQSMHHGGRGLADSLQNVVQQTVLADPKHPAYHMFITMPTSPKQQRDNDGGDDDTDPDFDPADEPSLKKKRTKRDAAAVITDLCLEKDSAA